MSMRNDDNNRIFLMYLNSGVLPNYNDNYAYISIPLVTDRWALYALTCDSGNNTAMYTIDNTGTTVATSTSTLTHRTAANVPVYIGVDSPFFFGTAREIEGSIRHAEYHKNVVLTQAELESAYNYLIT